MSSSLRLGVLATHPIQNHVPLYRALARAKDLDLVVLFGLIPDPGQQGVGFGVPFAWDIPMLEGYAWRALPSAKRSPSLRRFFGNRLKSLKASLKSERLDALILTGWNSYPLLQGLQAAASLGIPRVVRGDSNAVRRRPAGIRALHHALLRHYDAVLAVGKRNRDFYLGNGVPEARIFSSPHFVDNDRLRAQFRDASPRRDEFRERWNIPQDAVCFLFAGKLQSKKHPKDLLSALPAAFLKNSDIHLLFVGSGELMAELQDLVSERRLPVSFAGFLNQTRITDAYAACDCLVLPSDSGETWGLVVNEAMACGLPAIVSDEVGCGPDLVEDSITGWTFRRGDTEDLAGRLHAAASSVDRLREMGNRARERVLTGYTVERAVEGTIKAARYVTAKRARA